MEKTNAPSEKAGFVPKSNVQSPADAGSVFPSGYQQSPDDYNIMAPATGGAGTEVRTIRLSIYAPDQLAGITRPRRLPAH